MLVVSRLGRTTQLVKSAYVKNGSPKHQLGGPGRCPTEISRPQVLLGLTHDRQAKTVRRIALALVALLVLAACSEPEAETAADAREKAQSLEGQAQTDEQRAVVSALNQLLENFREGPATPDGWPAELIPVPPGARPVASVQRSTLPNGAETMSMFYASDQSPQDVHASFRSQLPRRGWVEVKPANDGDLTTVSAQTEGFNGLFVAGPMPTVPRLESGETIDVLVILTTRAP